METVTGIIIRTNKSISAQTKEIVVLSIVNYESFLSIRVSIADRIHANERLSGIFIAAMTRRAACVSAYDDSDQFADCDGPRPAEGSFDRFTPAYIKYSDCGPDR